MRPYLVHLAVQAAATESQFYGSLMEKAGAVSLALLELIDAALFFGVMDETSPMLPAELDPYLGDVYAFLDPYKLTVA